MPETPRMSQIGDRELFAHVTSDRIRDCCNRGFPSVCCLRSLIEHQQMPIVSTCSFTEASSSCIKSPMLKSSDSIYPTTNCPSVFARNRGLRHRRDTCCPRKPSWPSRRWLGWENFEAQPWIWSRALPLHRQALASHVPPARGGELKEWFMRKHESLLGSYKNMLRGRMSSFDARLGRD
jgi:hypothetical protein